MKKISNYVKNSEFTLVFLHGWGGNQKSLLPLAEQFKGKYTYHLLCLEGFGDSKLEKEYQISDYLEDIKSFLDSLKSKQIVLIGHSFGGKLALMLHHLYPELKAVAIAPSIVKNPFSLKIWLKIRVYKLLKFCRLPLPYSLKGSSDYQNARGYLKKTFLNVYHAYLNQKEMNELQNCCIIGFTNDQDVKIKSLKKAVEKNENIKFYEYDGNHFAFNNLLLEIRTIIMYYLRGETC